MMPRSLALAILGTVLGTAPAFAQAPGDYAQPPGDTSPSDGYAQPPSETAPVVVVATPRPYIEPMRHRIAVGVQLGGFSIAPESAPEGMETQFQIAELNLRYRITRRLELFLAFTGGRQVIDDNGEQRDGELAMDQVTLGARFSFRPEHRWNWYLMAGFGSTLIADRNTPEELRDDLRRAHGMFGIGVERRWRQFALQAELRGVGVEKRDDVYMTLPVRDGGGTTDPSQSAEKLGGGQFSLGASFYF